MGAWLALTAFRLARNKRSIAARERSVLIPPSSRSCKRTGSADQVEEPIPSLAAIFRFAGPIAVSISCATLMGLADTAFVGRAGNPLELAALAPSTAIANGCGYVLSSVSMAVLILLSSKGGKDERCLCTALCAAAYLGVCASLIFLVFSRPLVLAFGASEGMLPYSLAYLRIRLLTLPMAALTSVQSAALLSTKDSWTPFCILSTAGVMNVVVDACLCPSYGAAGAAVGTSLSEAFACVCFALTLVRRGLLVNFARPPPGELSRFLRFVAPITFNLLLKAAAFLLVGTWATSLGAVPAAGHQIAISLFWLAALVISEPLLSTAQSFLPRFLGKREDARQRASQLLSRLFVAAVFGSVIAGACVWTASMPQNLIVFTSDLGILSSVPRLLLTTCVMVMPFSYLLEGSLLAAKEQVMVSRLLVCASSMLVVGLHVQQRLLPGLNLHGPWAVLLGFLLLRTLLYSARLRSFLVELGRRNFPRSAAQETAIFQ